MAKSGNLLLDALPPSEHDEVLARSRRVALRFRSTLIRAGDNTTTAYFPLSGVVSLVTLTRTGRTVETNQVGREGMVGLPVFLGVATMPVEAVVQVPGAALAIPIKDFVRLSSDDTALSRVLKRYAYTRLVEAAQNAACNRLHSLEQRAARWLLETRDRLDTPKFPLTHELLATLLGVQRPRVTEAARRLQRHGLIAYTRGRVELADPDALHVAACECYNVVRDELRALLVAEDSTGSR